VNGLQYQQQTLSATNVSSSSIVLIGNRARSYYGIVYSPQGQSFQFTLEGLIADTNITDDSSTNNSAEIKLKGVEFNPLDTPGSSSVLPSVALTNSLRFHYHLTTVDSTQKKFKADINIAIAPFIIANQWTLQWQWPPGSQMQLTKASGRVLKSYQQSPLNTAGTAAAGEVKLEGGPGGLTMSVNDTIVIEGEYVVGVQQPLAVQLTINGQQCPCHPRTWSLINWAIVGCVNICRQQFTNQPFQFDILIITRTAAVALP
jgi:hypothetical protein